MQPLDDEHTDLDEFEFESFAATRNLIGDKKHSRQTTAGRRRRVSSHDDPLYSDDWGDYDEQEFDEHY